MQFHQNYNLQNLNTFNVLCVANYFVQCNSVDDLRDIIETPIFKENKFLILGGGSNVLFTKNFEGLVIQNNILGIDVTDENENTITLKVGSGVVWNDFVQHCVQKNYGGIENLSLIPGSVGASPIQNIGAYGAEVAQVIVDVEGIDVDKNEVKIIGNSACAFSYRDSIFKQALKNKFIITSVSFKLQKHPVINIGYGDVAKRLSHLKNEDITIKDVSNTIIEIRTQKLPNPSILGNAGSFFKNVVIDKSFFDSLVLKYPSIPNYPFAEGVKIPTAWLIEQCGFKGLQIGNVGCYKNQPLVIVNYGGATGKEVFDYSTNVINAVYQKFGITLEREVNVI